MTVPTIFNVQFIFFFRCFTVSCFCLFDLNHNATFSGRLVRYADKEYFECILDLLESTY